MVRGGDAVGNDILGMYRALEAAGFRPAILCEYCELPPALALDVRAGPRPQDHAGDFDAVVYHHSIYWPAGDAVLADVQGPRIVKYHNVTPMAFFEGYSEDYVHYCREGRLQTSRLCSSGRVTRWQADSTFNALELGDCGEDTGRIDIVPPFTRAPELLSTPRNAVGGGLRPVIAAIVARVAPNKGHADILRMAGAWRSLMPEQPLELRFVGGQDPRLARYRAELDALGASLGLQGSIQWIEGASDDAVADLLRTADVYLNFSRHEGFCVPLVEAQALGLPTVSYDIGAVRETAGPGQVVLPPCASPEDFATLAGVVHAVATSPLLRGRIAAAGRENVRSRFTRERTASAFVASLRRALGD
jgi:glycosyltransferase involved in cell wall biosynthesis